MNAYLAAYRKNDVETASPARIILMLYDGLIDSLDASMVAIRAKEIEAAHSKLIKSEDILAELVRSLNMELGGEVAQNLFNLYHFMINHLVDANLTKSETKVMEVRNMIKPIRDAWEEAAVKAGMLTEAA